MGNRGVSRTLAALVLVGLALFAQPDPASAHNGQDHDADALHPNLQSSIESISPDLQEVQVRVLHRGDSIEVTNLGDEELLIPGYEGEPYLRIGPDGVYENVLSPAGAINSSRYGGQEAFGDASAEPDWRKIDDGRSVQWHDHRIHWMSPEAPKVGRDEPTERHVIIEDWVVPISYGGAKIDVTGDLVWNASQPTSVWLAGALLVAALSIALALRKPVQVMLVSLVVLVVIYLTHHATSGTTSEGIVSQFGVPAIVSLAALTAAYLSTRRTWRLEATVVAVIASAFMLVTIGIADISRLSPSVFDSALISGCIASGISSIVASLVVLQSEQRMPLRVTHT